VILVDVSTCMILRVLKGYRSAQTAWIVVPKVATQRDTQPPSADTTPAHLEESETLLVVFAPKRGAVELWRAHAGVRIGLVPTRTHKGVLMQQPALPAAMGAGLGGAWRRYQPNACHLLDLESLDFVDLSRSLGELYEKYKMCK